MKKLLILFSIAIALTSIISCTKTGPAGPAGTNGTNGQSVIVSIDTFSVPIASWVMTQTNFYKYVRTNTNITKQVVDAGTIMVYARNSTYPDWYAMPYTVPGQAGQRFSYSLNTLTLLSENYTSGIPYVYQFKVVIYK